MKEQPTVYRSSSGWALALTSAAFFMAALDTLVVMTALPAMTRELSAGASTLQWTINAYSLASAAGFITGAALGDRFGRRRVFLAGLSLFTAASAACALAPTVWWLIGARALQGIGASLLIPLSLTILVTAIPAERRNAIVGVWGGIAGLAVAGGPLFGGAVTQWLSWHWIFWLNVPIGLAAIVLSALRLAESRGPATRIDPVAAGLISAGALAIVWGLLHAGEAGLGNPLATASMAAGMLFLIGFISWERRRAEPMLPLRLFRNRSFVAANTASFLMSGALLGAAFLISEYLQVALGESPLNAGLRFLPMTAAPLVVAPLAGLLADRVGTRPVMCAGLLLLAVGLAWFSVAATSGASYGQLVMPLLIAGAGVSMPFATAPAAALSAVAPADMGKASGANGTLQRFGGAFGIAVATAVFTASGQTGTPAGFDAGLRPALLVAAALSALGALSALAAGSRRFPPAGKRSNPLPVRPERPA